MSEGGELRAEAAAIAHLLGGKKALGVGPAAAVDWNALIRAGMPVRSAEALKESIAVPDSLLAELLGISEKTHGRGPARCGWIR